MSNALIKSLKKSNKKRLEQEAKNKERNAKRAIAKKEKKEGVMWNLEKQILMIYQK